jgi:hypothetical protein
MRVLPGSSCFICLAEFSEGEVASTCITCSLRTEIGTALVWHDACTKNWETACCPYCAEPLRVLPWTARNGESISRAVQALSKVFIAVRFVVHGFVWKATLIEEVFFAWYAHSTVLSLCVGFVVVPAVAGLAWALLQRWPRMFNSWQPLYTVGITMGIPFLFIQMHFFKQVMCFCFLCGTLYCCVTQAIDVIKEYVVMPIIALSKLNWRCTGNPRIRSAPVAFGGT